MLSMTKGISCCLCLLVFCCLTFLGCSRKDNDSERSVESKGTITKVLFGKMPDGREVYLYTIDNGRGLIVKATNYGGIITSIITPDRTGKPGDVVLGFDSLQHYLARHPHMGPLIGRYSGYIAGGRFSLDGVEYQLTTNSGPNHLHGGPQAFDEVLWNAREIRDENGTGLMLSYTSSDGEQGYPDNVDVSPASPGFS
jgi:aldose 1-epimerase